MLAHASQEKGHSLSHHKSFLEKGGQVSPVWDSDPQQRVHRRSSV